MTADHERREIFRVATSAQQLIDNIEADRYNDPFADLLRVCLDELQDRADVELLSRILDRNAFHERRYAAAEGERENERQRLDEARQRTAEVAALAAKVDCATCNQSAGEPCLTMTAYPRPRARHAGRIKSSEGAA